MSELKRLILTFKPEELIVHALYRSQDGPGPSTKRRQREVSDLVRAGLEDALKALEGDVTLCGTSGYVTREDIVVASEAKQVKREAEEGSAA